MRGGGELPASSQPSRSPAAGSLHCASRADSAECWWGPPSDDLARPALPSAEPLAAFQHAGPSSSSSSSSSSRPRLDRVQRLAPLVQRPQHVLLQPPDEVVLVVVVQPLVHVAARHVRELVAHRGADGLGQAACRQGGRGGRWRRGCRRRAAAGCMRGLDRIDDGWREQAAGPAPAGRLTLHAVPHARQRRLQQLGHRVQELCGRGLRAGAEGGRGGSVQGASGAAPRSAAQPRRRAASSQTPAQSAAAGSSARPTGGCGLEGAEAVLVLAQVVLKGGGLLPHPPHAHVLVLAHLQGRGGRGAAGDGSRAGTHKSVRGRRRAHARAPRSARSGAARAAGPGSRGGAGLPAARGGRGESAGGRGVRGARGGGGRRRRRAAPTGLALGRIRPCSGPPADMAMLAGGRDAAGGAAAADAGEWAARARGGCAA